MHLATRLLFGLIAVLPYAQASSDHGKHLDHHRRHFAPANDSFTRRAIVPLVRRASCTSASQCTAPANGVATCVSSTCGFTCKSGFLKNGSACIAKCTSASTCPKTANGTAVCTTSTGACSIKCASGYKLSGGLCVKTCTAASTCPTITNGTKTCVSGLCGFTCKTGYVKSGATCVLSCPSGTKLSGGKCVKTCTAASTCPVVANANPTCVSGLCGFTCKSGFKLSGGACVKTCSAASTCPTIANGTKTCVSGLCGFTCKTGYVKSGSTCVLKPVACSTASTCPTAPANGKAVCTSGFCKVQCNAKYILSPAGNSCIAVQCTSNSHCTSPPTNGEGGVCVNNSCSYSCQFGYDKVGSSCYLHVDTYTGNIRAERYRSGGSLGYLTTDLNSYSQYGFFAQRQYALKVQITKTIYTQSPYPLEILTKNYQYENYTYLAGVVGWNSINENMADYSFNYAGLSPGSYSLPNAKPDYFSSAYWDKTGVAEKMQASIFVHDSSSGQLYGSWINSNGASAGQIYFFALPGDSALILSASWYEFQRSFPNAIPVELFLDEV